MLIQAEVSGILLFFIKIITIALCHHRSRLCILSDMTKFKAENEMKWNETWRVRSSVKLLFWYHFDTLGGYLMEIRFVLLRIPSGICDKVCLCNCNLDDRYLKWKKGLIGSIFLVTWKRSDKNKFIKSDIFFCFSTQ